MSDTFIKDIEDNIFNKRLIYRSIFVVENDKELQVLMEKMSDREYSIIAVKEIDRHIDYNKIDNRIVMLTHDTFVNFISNLTRYGNILDSSYNLIAFSYEIDYNTVADLMSFYCNITNKNSNSTILFDHHYTQFARLEKDIESILM